MKRKLYYAETGRGACIRAGLTRAETWNALLKEIGTTAGVKLIRLATEKDIAWVKGMGGLVPRV